jgi:hypothetical protein
MVFYSTTQLMKETIVIIALTISTITAIVVLETVLPILGNNISQLAYAQTNATTNNMTMAKSENITAPVAPQGTSINVSNTTTTP